jgi:hypothetical protein
MALGSSPEVTVNGSPLNDFILDYFRLCNDIRISLESWDFRDRFNAVKMR